MRVLHILGQRPDGTGSGVFVRHAWDEGQRAGNEVHVLHAAYLDDRFSEFFGDSATPVTCGTESADYPSLIPGMSDIMPYPSVRYTDLDSEDIERFLAAYETKLKQLLNWFRPDVLHFHHLWVLLGLLRTGMPPAVVTIHGTGLQQSRLAPQHRSFVERGVPHVRRFMGVSAEVVRTAGEQFAIPPGRIQVVGNGYDPRVFRPEGPIAEGPDGQVVLAVGKFVRCKGFEHLIRAFSRAALPATRLVILGTGPEEEINRLRSVARQELVGNLLHLPGHVVAPAVAQWMRRADLFVLSSTSEAFGLVLLEAMACGCRAVATRTAGPMEFVSEAMLSTGAVRLVELPRDDSSAETRQFEVNLGGAIRAALVEDHAVTDRHALSRPIEDRTWSGVNRTLQDVYAGVIQPN